MPSQTTRISPRRARPPQAWPPSRPTRERSEVARRLGQHVLRYAASRYIEQFESRSQEESQQGGRQGQQSQGSGTGQVVMDVLVRQLLEEVIQYLVRHHFFRRGRNSSRPGTGTGTGTGIGIGTGTGTRTRTRNPTATETVTVNARNTDRNNQGESLNSQSSYEQRRSHRRERRTEAMMVSLDRLSNELELTHVALLRVIHSPRNCHTENEPLLANASDLRRAITRSMARIESVRNHYHCESRRPSRYERAARGDGRGSSRSSSQFHSQSSR